MRFTHKLGLIILVVLLLALAMSNVSVAEGTQFSKIYDFTDSTNNKAYEGTTSDTTTGIDDPYDDLTSIEDTFQEYVTPKTVGVFAYTRFEFKINESAGSINEINITWIGRGDHADHSYPDGYNLYVYNVTSGSWMQEKSYSTDNTKQTENIVYTSGFSDYINTSGYLKVLARSNSSATSNKAVDIKTDYIDVNVTYFKIGNVSTDKLTYKNGETISATWDNEGGFGSGENCINVEYWDVTAGTQFNLTSHATSATSSTSRPLTSSEVGHKINVYVYSTSSSSGNNSTAITQGEPWGYSPSEIQGSLITSCDINGNEINQFAPGEKVYMKATGLEASTSYKIWLQNYAVTEGAALQTENDESSTQELVTTATNGSFGYGVGANSTPVLIWNISSTAAVTHHEHDIAVDHQSKGTVGTYNAADDGLDSASVAGIVAPVPDVSALVLFASGLMLAAVYFVYGRRGKGNRKGEAQNAPQVL
jgi:hypothetical protein